MANFPCWQITLPNGKLQKILNTNNKFRISQTMPTYTATPDLLDNTHVTEGRYIAHIAIPCRDLAETESWYSRVLGAEPVRVLADRVTFSFGGILQLVCHLEKRAVDPNPRAYPRHFGLTFLQTADFTRLQANIEKCGVKFMVPPGLRFPDTPHEHLTMMLVDPSFNVVEFKSYLHPENSY
jgi:uncharacterized protein